MGHKENGGIGITGLKMGLAVSPCHIIFSLDIFCKSFVPLPSFLPTVEFVITPWKKCREYCCQEKDCQFSWNGSRIFCIRTWGNFSFCIWPKNFRVYWDILFPCEDILPDRCRWKLMFLHCAAGTKKCTILLTSPAALKVSNINFWVFMDPSHMKNSNGSHFYIVPTSYGSLEMCLFSIEFAILRACYQIRFLQVQAFK